MTGLPMFMVGAPVSASAQLKTSLDSIGTTVESGDDYARYAEAAKALNAYRQAAIAFQALPPEGQSAALAGDVLAITSPTAANLAQARELLVELFRVYESTIPIPDAGPALATTPPAAPAPASPSVPNVMTTTAAPSSGAGVGLVLGVLTLIAGGVVFIVTRGRV